MIMKKTLKSLIFATTVALVLTLGMALITSAADVLDGKFNSTEGTLNWAYLENGGEFQGRTYSEKTLVIYGSGTSYTYNSDTYSSLTLPWSTYNSVIKHIVITAENLTSFKCFAKMSALETIELTNKIDNLDDIYPTLDACKKLRSVTVTGEDYSFLNGAKNIFDFRFIKSLRSNALRNVGDDVNEVFTVLLSENLTFHNVGGTRAPYFFSVHSEEIIVYVHEGAADEKFMKDKIVRRTNSENIADKITLVYYPETEIIDPSTLNKALVFEGYQVRTKVMPKADGTGNAENGLRTLFYCDLTCANEGFTLVEYGTLIASQANAANTYLDKDNNFVVGGERVVKTAVYKNGEYATLRNSDDENKIKFATTIINFAETQYSTPLYIRGYEIWENDSTNEKYVIYSDSMVDEETVYYPSLCDVTINCFAYGIINSADQDENEILWKVLDTCRFELTEGTTEYSGGTRIYELEDNVITVSERSTDPNFSSNDTTIQVFETENNGLVAIVRGTGKAYRTTEMLKSCCNAAVETIVYDDGLTAFGFGDFKNNADVKYVVYPDTLVGTGTEVFNKAPNITAVSKVKTMRVDGLIDLSYLDGVGFSSSSYLFAGVSSSKKENIEYIYLPSVVSDKAITTLNDFTYITNLNAVWCVGNIMIEGKVNFEGTNIIGDEKAFANSGISTENIIWGTEPVVEETPVE